MGDLIKVIGKELYERVVVSNVSTFVGIGLSILIIVGDQLYAYLTSGISTVWAAPLAMVVAAIGTLLKNRLKVAQAEAAAKLKAEAAAAAQTPEA